MYEYAQMSVISYEKETNLLCYAELLRKKGMNGSMKKTLSLLLAALLALSAAGCGTDDGADHQHDYTAKKMEDAYVAAEANCLTGRLYFYACSICGKSCGLETDTARQYVWQGSDALGHDLQPTGCTREGCSWSSADSGTLTNGIQWSYYSDGTLYFYGSGNLPDWTEDQMLNGEIPWMSYPVRTVVLPKNISSIGDRSFTGLGTLSTISLPWGVTIIGESAFEGCGNLKTLELPDSLNTIGKNAFRSCTSLTEVTLPRYTVFADGNIFANCTSLANISVAQGNTAFTVKNGCLIETSTGTLVAATVSGAIPDDGSVKIIGESAFEGHAEITTIHIPASVTSIREKAFYNCPNVTAISVDVTNQSYTAKGNCLIERATKKLIQGCASSELPVDGSVTEIADYAFANCSGLTTLHLPGTVSSIAGTAFIGCSGLESITAATGNTYYSAMGNCLIISGTMTLILGCKNSVIPTDGSVIRIGNGAFSGTAITEMVIPDIITEIGASAFEDCKDLKSVTFGKGITALDAQAFMGCSALETLTVADGHPNLTVTNGCLIDTSSGTLLLGTGTSDGEKLEVTSIAPYAFAGRTALSSFYIPKSVTSVGDGAFYGCSALTSIEFEGSEEEWTAVTLGNAWNAFTAAELTVEYLDN